MVQRTVLMEINRKAVKRDTYYKRLNPHNVIMNTVYYCNHVCHSTRGRGWTNYSLDSITSMTQAGKRRREGVVEVPDFEGLYAAQKAVKKRRRGVVKPPVLEELQLPEQHAVLAGNGVCDANNNSPVAEGDAETTNRVDEGAKDEATK